jgi:restriction system protein
MRKERDPSRLWLDDGCAELIIDGKDFIVDSETSRFAVFRGPEVLLQTAILSYGDKTDEGVLVRAVAIPWFEIMKQVGRDPSFLSEFSSAPRKFEEFIAGAYRQDGWDEVTLTPASGDRGRDVIATKTGVCSLRVLDQTKAYSPGHLVSHNDVRAMLGVLAVDQNVSKGFITTTSDFEPCIRSAQSEFAKFMPYRLDLRNGSQLLKWLSVILRRQRDGRERLTREEGDNSSSHPLNVVRKDE